MKIEKISFRSISVIIGFLAAGRGSGRREYMQSGYDLDGIREEILAMADETYKEFQKKLLPEVKNYVGVRLPALRKLAKRVAKENGKGYLETALGRNAETELFEEIMLQGMVIGYWKGDLSDIFAYTELFLPKVDNWSVCDSFCSGFKHVLKDREKVWEWLGQFFGSDREFTVRFAVVMLLDYYVEEEYINRLWTLLNNVRHEGYYVKMAVAWAVSICYIKYPEAGMAYLKENKLDDFTYNKALQKIMESQCISAQEKERIRWMKR